MKHESLPVSQELLTALKNQFLFKDIDEERLGLMLEKASDVHVLKEEIIFRKGESYHKGIYLLISGKVSLKKDDGTNVIIGNGDLAGLTNFLGKSTYIVSAVAQTDAELVFFPELCIYKLMEDYQEFRDRFYKLSKERLNVLSADETRTIISSTYKSVGSYMSSPVFKIHMNKTVIEASQLMSEHNVGALAVVDRRNNLKGLLTSKHLVHRFLPNVEQNLSRQAVDNYMNADVISLPQEFPLVEALAEMQTKGEDYALVVRQNKPIGIVSGKDIMKTLFRDINIFSTHLDQVETIEDLKKAHAQLFRIAESMVGNTRLTHQVLPVLSAIHLTIQKKVYRVSENAYYEKTGFDIHSVRHAIIIMGSGGRKEMVLDPDQDHGVILPDDTPQEIADHFVAFGQIFSDNLAYVGYAKCKGNIMISNPAMTKTLKEWKKDIAKWINNPGSAGLVWSSIIFDLDIFDGDEALVWELREFILKKIQEKPIFLIQMLEKDYNLKIPVSLFGKFITEKDGDHKDMINMKNSALAFIVDVTRAFSLYSGITDINTIERLNHLLRKKILSEETVMLTINAYESIVDILLNEQVRVAETGAPVTKHLNPNKLSLHNQERLKRALHHVSKFLSIALRYFKGHP